MLKIWQRSEIDMHKICQFYAKYMTNVCLRYVQDTQKILRQQKIPKLSQYITNIVKRNFQDITYISGKIEASAVVFALASITDPLSWLWQHACAAEV